MNTSKELLLVTLVKSAAGSPLADLNFDRNKPPEIQEASHTKKPSIKGWSGTPGNPYTYINPGYTNNPLSFMDWIKPTENPRKKGYTPATRMWKPYQDVDNMSVAYGQDDLYKTKNNPNARFSNQEVQESLNRTYHKNRLEYARDPRFIGLQRAPSRIKNIIYDIMYQSGDKAPKFWNAWKTGDRPKMLHELKTYYGPENDKKPDVRRNRLKEKMLRKEFDSMDAGQPLSSISGKKKSVV